MKRHKLADRSVVRWGEGLVARAKNASLGVGLIARAGGGRDAGVRKSVKGCYTGEGYNMYSMHKRVYTVLERDMICIACIARELMYTGEEYNMYSMHRHI